MRRLLMVVLVVAVAMSVVGCKKKAREPEGEKAEAKRTIENIAVKAEVEEEVKPDPNRSLVGWWMFDEVSGKTAKDSSGSGRDGVLGGNLSFDSNSVPGRVGKALKFEGGDRYIEIPGYKGIVGTAPRSVTAWIKARSSDGHIMSWGEQDAGRMFIFGFVRGRIGVTPHGGYLYMKDSVSDDAWHHVAVVVEDVELPNLHDHVKIFLDGDVAEIHDIGILDLWPIDTGGDLDVRIGKGFKGAIDDLRLYDRPLLYDEVRMLFRSAERRD